MTGLKSDFRLISDKKASGHPAWPYFKKAMQGKAYGREAINDAWSWFKDGWDYGNPIRRDDKERK